ncbi:MAG: tetratricopeptide repeat protein [Planctomycetes bacterium]|nr:tetratricopeptide repeat protein [Planctomycetota bacterium]
MISKVIQSVLIVLSWGIIVCCSPAKSEEALSEYNKAKKITENNPDTALKLLDKAIELDPIFPQAFQQKALIYEKQNRTDLAEINYTKAIEVSPTDKSSIYYHSRARYYHRNKKYDKAERDYKIALENSSFDPNRIYYLLNYATLLEDTERYMEAINKYAEILDSDIEPSLRSQIQSRLVEIKQKIK